MSINQISSMACLKTENLAKKYFFYFSFVYLISTIIKMVQKSLSNYFISISKELSNHTTIFWSKIYSLNCPLSEICLFKSLKCCPTKINMIWIAYSSHYLSLHISWFDIWIKLIDLFMSMCLLGLTSKFFSSLIIYKANSLN